ncbi:MAG: hypothetical protein IJE17_01275 [Clostridia bacterium]|nr:hypothetical protein [Clostridiales bacterium]MBQ2976101.1 hypothetical protein [Clostridia bacterium]MBQ6805334.1 hypothetical protein [Clostridia bacterium]
MKLVKCPRCELNYIQEDEDYCKICKREMKGERQHDEIEMCTVCNEAPALPGKDVCLFCLKEMNSNNDRHDDENEGRVGESSLGIDPVSSMDEIIPEIDEDIPEREYDEIESDLSLDEMGEEEAEDDEDEDE